ncbi:hypothetical protein FM105_01445 [Brevibacterium yomogidense]|uniref:Uncharacterized protein n=1 Tax=Brevibacterium yomogidense TaxID=946573 RepID=A0A1X6WVN1_9MICO|nr:hypothetical protein FM105_01445 [Brevibacterium yomogidense]
MPAHLEGPALAKLLKYIPTVKRYMHTRMLRFGTWGEALDS